MSHRLLTVLIVSLMAFPSLSTVFHSTNSAQLTGSAAGASYLSSSQSASGAWSDSARDTAAAMAVLQSTSSTSPALGPAYAWLANRPTRATADLAHATIALAGGQRNVAALATALLAAQNSGVIGSGAAPSLYTAAFDAPSTDWQRGGLAICYDPEYVQGQLRVVSSSHPFNPDCWLYTSPVLSDVDIQVEARKDTTRIKAAYGIVFRAQPGQATFGGDNSFYSFEVDPVAGTYYLGMRVGEVKTPLVNWTLSNAIKRDDAVNLLRVTAEGATIKAYINNTLLTTVTDGALAAGSMGLIVRDLDESLKPLSARFDNFIVYRGRSFSSVRPNGNDGGWGAAPGYTSDNLHTALALSALRAARVSGPGVPRGVAYLVAAQNGDGGWGLARGSSSMPAFTAHVLIALSGYPSLNGVAGAMERGAAHLTGRQHGDGGWGAEGSTVIESALALRALTLTTTKPSAAGMAYLNRAQQANGSWNNRPYDTALAALALGQSERRTYLPLTRR